MTEHSDAEPTNRSEQDPTDEQTTAAAQAPSEPAVERSRFSQWLASFGLGEVQHPLLTRTRASVPRPPAV